jgi:hypothetical protein
VQANFAANFPGSSRVTFNHLTVGSYGVYSMLMGDSRTNAANAKLIEDELMYIDADISHRWGKR